MLLDDTFALKGGTAINPFVRDMRHATRDTLQADLDTPVVSLEDLYGGKLVTAIDRQHRRALFDVMQLFAHEGITAGIRVGLGALCPLRTQSDTMPLQSRMRWTLMSSGFLQPTATHGLEETKE